MEVSWDYLLIGRHKDIKHMSTEDISSTYRLSNRSIELRRVFLDGFCNTCVVSSDGAVRASGASGVEGSVVVSIARGFGVEVCWSNLVTSELTRYVLIVFEWKESSVSVTANVNLLDIIAASSGGNPTVLLSGLNNALAVSRTIC